MWMFFFSLFHLLLFNYVIAFEINETICIYSYRLVITLWTLPVLSQFLQPESLNYLQAVISMWLLAGFSMLMDRQNVSPQLVSLFRTRFSEGHFLNICATGSMSSSNIKKNKETQKVTYSSALLGTLYLSAISAFLLRKFRCWIQRVSKSQKGLPDCGVLYSPQHCTQKQYVSWANSLGKFWSALILWPWCSNALTCFAWSESGPKLLCLAPK